MKKKAGVKKPNGLIYFIVYLLFYPFLKCFFRLKVDRSAFDPPKGPFIVVSNHVSFMDFLLVMLAVYPRRLNALAAQKFFFYRPLNWFLPLMGCIPKNLFDPDVRAVIGLKAVLKRGGRILLFPEGRCTVAGDYMGMHKAAGKLIQKLETPVLSCRLEGSYVCMPFWRKGFRFGRVRVTLANLFSAEETRSLTVDGINQRIDARLSGADSPPPPKPLRTFGLKRLAEGLHNILYWCPKCDRELTLETEGCAIRCTACGNAAAMDSSAKLVCAPDSAAPEDVQSWYREQTLREMRFLHEDMAPVVIPVRVKTALSPGKGLEPCGQGSLSLEPDGWRYEGELLGEQTKLFIPISAVPAVPFDPGDQFQINIQGVFYAFLPEDGRLCSKYAAMAECAYWRFAPQIQMTPGRNSGFCAPAANQ
ncbi:MAG: 1-acyl-sn-glycerol-3-phosphate acyltransferase [Oscillospiraceae bacterium]|nr:1-acyl-sn-glycerol-3-phosphate acyltransferase [Oscillospiraceae bacterium]